MKHERLSIPVEEYTTPNPVVGKEDMTVEDLSGLMTEHGVRHLPIVRNKAVVGILSDRDLRVARGLSKNEKQLVRASDIMALNPVSVSATDNLDEVAFRMAQEKIGSVLVMDDQDELLGIFTVTDALNALIELTRGDEL